MDPLTLGIIALGFAAIGGVIGGISTGNKLDQNSQDLETAARNLEENYSLAKKNATDEYNFAKQEALDNAAQSDKASDRNENLTSLMFNTAAEQLQMNQEDQNMQNQQSAISAGSATSQQEAQLASSGVRASSSASAAVQSNDILMQQQLAQNIKGQESANSGELVQAYAGLVNNMASIGQSRYNANYIRSSYEQGGKNYELYQNQMNSMASRYTQQSAAIATQQNRLEENRPWDIISGIFGGAQTGYEVGTKIGNFASNWNANLSSSLGSTQDEITFDKSAFGIDSAQLFDYSSSFSGLSSNSMFKINL